MIRDLDQLEESLLARTLRKAGSRGSKNAKSFYGDLAAFGRSRASEASFFGQFTIMGAVLA